MGAFFFAGSICVFLRPTFLFRLDYTWMNISSCSASPVTPDLHIAATEQKKKQLETHFCDGKTPKMNLDLKSEVSNFPGPRSSLEHRFVDSSAKLHSDLVGVQFLCQKTSQEREKLTSLQQCSQQQQQMEDPRKAVLIEDIASKVKHKRDAQMTFVKLRQSLIAIFPVMHILNRRLP